MASTSRTMNGGTEVGVYWGRFNPPHRGHLKVIRRFAGRCQLLVAIGSSERTHTRENPFSGRERRAMLQTYLAESGIKDVRVILLRDGPSVRWAVDNLVRRCRPEFVLLSDEKTGLVRVAARRIKVVRFRRTGEISSSRIRTLIASGDPSWKRLAGRSVTRLIEGLGGVARIRRLYRGRTDVVLRSRPKLNARHQRSDRPRRANPRKGRASVPTGRGRAAR